MACLRARVFSRRCSIPASSASISVSTSAMAVCSSEWGTQISISKYSFILMLGYVDASHSDGNMLLIGLEVRKKYRNFAEIPVGRSRIRKLLKRNVPASDSSTRSIFPD